jgi:hypothetical protein
MLQHQHKLRPDSRYTLLLYSLQSTTTYVPLSLWRPAKTYRQNRASIHTLLQTQHPVAPSVRLGRAVRLARSRPRWQCLGGLSCQRDTAYGR